MKALIASLLPLIADRLLKLFLDPKRRRDLGAIRLGDVLRQTELNRLEREAALNTKRMELQKRVKKGRK